MYIYQINYLFITNDKSVPICLPPSLDDLKPLPSCGLDPQSGDSGHFIIFFFVRENLSSRSYLLRYQGKVIRRITKKKLFLLQS